MKGQTTDEMISLANKIAQEIQEAAKKFGVVECWVDDYGAFGNFAVLASFEFRPDLRSIGNTIKKVLKAHSADGIIHRSTWMPKPKYRHIGSIYGKSEKSFDGYDVDHISIDVDFVKYDKNTNTFATQTQMELF